MSDQGYLTVAKRKMRGSENVFFFGLPTYTTTKELCPCHVGKNSPSVILFRHYVLFPAYVCESSPRTMPVFTLCCCNVLVFFRDASLPSSMSSFCVPPAVRTTGAPHCSRAAPSPLACPARRLTARCVLRPGPCEQSSAPTRSPCKGPALSPPQSPPQSRGRRRP